MAPPQPVTKSTPQCPAGMVYIPEGTFLMGTMEIPFVRSEGDPDESPVHAVTVAGFCIDKYEVTNEQYAAAERPKTTLRTQYQLLGATSVLDGPRQPAVMVTWREAADYCHMQGKRLPTEAEWERTAKGPSGTAVYGTKSGLLSRDEAHYYSADRPTIAPANVGSYPPNGFGVCDLTGNAWEWTADWYGAEYYAQSSKDNPTGPANGTS